MFDARGKIYTSGSRSALEEPFLPADGLRAPSPIPSPAALSKKLVGPDKKPALPARWIILFLASFVMFGNYVRRRPAPPRLAQRLTRARARLQYCYDNPAALFNNLRAEFGSRSPNFQEDFNWLYSIYSLPNLVLPLIGGVLCDRVGAYISLMLFTSFVLIGQLVCVLGAATDSMTTLMVGRAIFGLGGESLSVAQNAIVTEWFAGKELAMALGVNLSVGRVGSVVNNCISPWIANHSSLTIAFATGARISGCARILPQSI